MVPEAMCSRPLLFSILWLIPGGRRSLPQSLRAPPQFIPLL